ncbi:hypothetical protein ACG2F4_13020 [Halalkalibaculum sp. DA3122]|uniref:hypothetical protein n=1 Tax=unclassified Halalkalibaculum TaxID=2964617 RepID=UPI0037546707
MSSQDREQENLFHERISILQKQGYRGFSVHKVRKKWDGVQVTARNDSGRTVSGFGETNEEAHIKVIEKIDEALEIQ